MTSIDFQDSLNLDSYRVNPGSKDNKPTLYDRSNLKTNKFIKDNERFSIISFLNPSIGGPHMGSSQLIRGGSWYEHCKGLAKRISYIAVNDHAALDLSGVSQWTMHPRTKAAYSEIKYGQFMGLVSEFIGPGHQYCIICSNPDASPSGQSWSAIDTKTTVSELIETARDYYNSNFRYNDRVAEILYVMRINWSFNRRGYSVYVPEFVPTPPVTNDRVGKSFDDWLRHCRPNKSA